MYNFWWYTPILTTMTQESHNVTLVVLACATLHNIIMTLYRADHQGLSDEDNNHRQVPNAWRKGQVLPDVGEPPWWNHATIAAKRKRVSDSLLQQCCWGSLGGQINHRSNLLKSQRFHTDTERSSFTRPIEDHIGGQIKTLLLCIHSKSSVSLWQ